MKIKGYRKSKGKNENKKGKWRDKGWRKKIQERRKVLFKIMKRRDREREREI